MMYLVSNPNDVCLFVARWKKSATHIELTKSNKAFGETNQQIRNGNDSIVQVYSDSYSSPLPYSHEGTENLSRSSIGILNEIRVLLIRHCHFMAISITGFILTVVKFIVGGIVYGVLYYRNGADLDNYIYNVWNFYFGTVVFLIFASSVTIPNLFSMKSVYDREQVSNHEESFMQSIL
jgi:hypothetical protein